MNDEEFIDFVADFLSSDDWIDPCIEFKTMYCSSFNPNVDCSLNEFQIYNKFIDLIQNVIENCLCPQMYISMSEFETRIIKIYDNENYRAKTVVQSLSKLFDFVKFKEDMIRYKEDLEEEEENYENSHPSIDYEIQASFILGSERQEEVFPITPPAPRDEPVFSVRPPDQACRISNIRSKFIQKRRKIQMAEIIKPNKSLKINLMRSQMNGVNKVSTPIYA